MRWIAGRRQEHSTQEHGRRRLARALIIALSGVFCLSIAACGSPPALQLPGGAYSSVTYGFHVTYPANWKANPSQSTPAATGAVAPPIPFTLIITRTGDTHSVASLISTCTITVMDMKNSDIAASAATLATNTALQPATIGGVQGYKSAPLTQDVPSTQISVTHIDYYVVHGGYEYQISTDSVKGDNADNDLQSIIASFTFNA